jgi:hypothetical protein
LTEYFAFAAMIQQSHEATSLASQPRIKRDPTRIHRDDLPPPPRHRKELKCHPHGKQFEAAAYTKFGDCWKKGTFASLDITAENTADAVPLMWVFTLLLRTLVILYPALPAVRNTPYVLGK